MATRLRSFSKVNLGLRIGPARPDGFHGLATIYQTLALYDHVTLSASPLPADQPSCITLTCDNPRVPADNRNTAWRMVERALRAIDVIADVSIHIRKLLPVQGGMGAGSANAAAALFALERELLLWDRPAPRLSQINRLRLAAEVGSDVPLFLVGGAVLGTGRGEQVSPLPDMTTPPETSALRSTAGIPCVVAIPKVGVSTPYAFREWDARNRSAEDLTSVLADDTLKELSLAYSSVRAVLSGGHHEPVASGIVRKTDPDNISFTRGVGSGDDLAEKTLLSLVRTGIENDFEEVVFSHHPSLREIKRLLTGEASSLPAVYAALSGSGSALFGLYRSMESARAAQQRVQSSGTEAILTETLTREMYWTRMFADVG